MSAIEIFDNDDNKYLNWMASNPTYFVVNALRSLNSNYLVLHKSKCPHISTTSRLKKGAYTERTFVKIGSDDLNQLKNWFSEKSKNFNGNFDECKTCNPISEKFIDNEVFLFPEIVENDILFEGAKKQITVNSYERNIKARKKCLKHYGYKCTICNFDFEKKYGIIGKEFIHVHHLKEIHEIGKTYEVDPINDLRPICPNCHSMIHQKKPCYTIEELKAIIEEL